MISVVIPTLNAERFLPQAMAPLVSGVVAELVKEVIVVDGGSSDATLDIADATGCTVVTADRGRGAQLAAAAAAARAPWLLFLHADTVLDGAWVEETQRFIRDPGNIELAAAYRFAFDDVGFGARQAAFWVGLRCAVLKLPYGDQGLLISRRLYDAVGGYRPLPLMEDVDLVRRIGGRRMRFLQARAVTSAEKYRRDGYLRRSFGNLALLARFYLGADPAVLARAYDRKA